MRANGTGANFGKVKLRTENGDFSIKIIKTLGPNQDLWIISTDDQAVKVEEDHSLVTT